MDESSAYRTPRRVRLRGAAASGPRAASGQTAYLAALADEVAPETAATGRHPDASLVGHPDDGQDLRLLAMAVAEIPSVLGMTSSVGRPDASLVGHPDDGQDPRLDDDLPDEAVPPRRPRRVWLIGLLVVALAAAGVAITAAQRAARPDPLPPTPLPSPSQAIPANLVAVYEGYVPDGGTFRGASLTLLVSLRDGVLAVDTARCLISGAGDYTLTVGGAWSLSPAGLAEAQCPNDLVAHDYAVLVDALTQGTSWRAVEYDGGSVTSVQGLPAGLFFTVNGGGNTVYLRVPDTYRPEALPEFGSLAPSLVFPMGSGPSSLIGTWDIVPGQGVSLVAPLPTLEITDTQVVLPPGCNFGTDGFMATADGRWYFGSDLIATDTFGCEPERTQVDVVYQALATARGWSVAEAYMSQSGSGQDDAIYCGKSLEWTDQVGTTVLVATNSWNPTCDFLPLGASGRFTVGFQVQVTTAEP